MPNVCLVTSEIVGPFKNGGIGTHNYYLMQYLSEISEISCTIIYNGAIESHSHKYWQSKFKSDYDAEFVWISPDRIPQSSKPLSSCYWERISQANLDYLQNNEFDLVLFQEMLGGGFRAIQAKKSLGLFPHTILAVMVHSSWQWVNESMQLYPAYGLPEMLTKYMERYSVQHCDSLISPSQYMLNWSASDVEKLPELQQVVPYLFDPTLRKAGPRERARELIFFGRLEQRKGLILFLDSLNIIQEKLSKSERSDRIAVYFLGRAGQTEDGDGSQTIHKYMPLLEDTFDLQILSDLGHHEALDFLRSHPAAIVACPSLQDNSPFAVIENILLGTNLISCRTGGIPELFADDSRLAEPTVADLSRLLLSGLSDNLPDVNAAYSIEKARQAWSDFFTTHIAAAQALATGPSNAPQVVAASSIAPFPLISISAEPASSDLKVAQHDNRAILRGELLLSNPQALIHEAQAHSHVLLLGTGFRLVHAAETALNTAVHSCPDCVWTGYTEYQYNEPLIDTPIGPCLEALLAENVLGNGVVILPTPILTQLDSRGLKLMHQLLTDARFFWSFLAHLALSGNSIDVIPQTLCCTSEPIFQPLPQASLYAQRSEIMATMSSNLPRWTQRLLPYIVDITPSYQPNSESASAKPIEDRRSLPSLLRYYWQRIKG